jgi:hypothetical protein
LVARRLATSRKVGGKERTKLIATSGHDPEPHGHATHAPAENLYLNLLFRRHRWSEITI